MLDHVGGETVGGGLPPPTPSAWAPSAQPLGPIRLFALYTYIGAYLWLKSKNPAAPGIELFLAPCAILPAGVYSKLNGSEVRAWSAELKSDPFGLESLM